MPSLIGPADLAPPQPPDPAHLIPPPRFGKVSFATYQPQDPSQQAARERLQAFVGSRTWGLHVARPAWPFARRGKRRSSGSGIYLDGGFGVGKTHLLASAYGEADTASKHYLGFQELVYLIGVMGRQRAESELAGTDLLCIDEFELDDPGNTLIVKSFLAAHMAAGGSVVTTSNTPPEAQGKGRFSAEDFRREIQSLAASFEVLNIGGPDYRRRLATGDWQTEAELELLKAKETGPLPGLALSWGELLTLLAGVHPSRYGGLLGQVSGVYLVGATTIGTQAEALRFVHFVDKLYDLGLRLRATGHVPLKELFDLGYRHSAYHKKHERCLSRFSELLGEAAGVAEASEAA